MFPRKSSLLLFCLSMVFCTTPAMAGVLAGDGSTYLGIWHGTTAYQGHDTLGNPTGLTGTLDWAVYAPNTAPAGLLGYTPTPNEFVYAYQAFETGSASLSSVAIVLENPADHIGDFTATGISGQAPFDEFLIPFDSANWLFDGVLAGGSTNGMVFSSPNLPKFTKAILIDDGSIGVAIPEPSPSSMNIPEPSTLTLAICGLVGFASQWLRRRGRRATL